MNNGKLNGTAKRTRFRLGRVLATPGALEALANTGQVVSEFLNRHVCGDWGNLSEEDRQANEQSLRDGTRLLSSYRLNDGTKIWIITEAADDRGCRVATT